MTFLGVDGFLVERGTESFMTGPLFSNPALGHVLGGKPIDAVPARIDAQLPTSMVEGLDAILVGHSHYDHLMDVPYIAKEKAKSTIVYGSRTMTHVIGKLVDPKRLVSLSSKVDYRMCGTIKPCAGENVGQAGDWEWIVGDPRSAHGLRVRAICSRHSPQFAGLPPLWPGCADQDRPPPVKASEWLLGDTLAYLVDFTELGKPVFRVYFQDSATDPTDGYVSPDLIDERSVDLALLCGGAFSQVRENPSGILANIKPRWILIGHWDDFFKPLEAPLSSLRAHDFAALVRELESATGRKPWEGKYWLPAPGQSFVFRP